MAGLKIGLAVLALCCVSSGAEAQQFGLSELRVGVQSHDVYYGFLPINPDRYNFGHIEDLSFDALFTSPDIDAFRWIGSPRPNIGATVNMRGYDSILHAGLTWQLPLGESPFFLEGTFGAAINNGSMTGASAPYKNFGCRVQFYEAAGIGANLSENVTALITYEHTSNLDMCAANEGLSNLGVRVGFKF
jgi:lipid A 3-O-deacylase